MDPALAARFAADLAALAEVDAGPDASGEALALAVSGGPDSLALLLLARAGWAGPLVAATVDHRLRPESAAEAQGVARLCARLAITHRILAPAEPPSGASPQAQAREVRYALLAGWALESGARRLATAHHLDDRAETLLMRLARGSGAGGLAGIRPARPLAPGLMLVRPLLGWRKAELVAIAAAAGLDPVDDPSNRSERHDRTRFRALIAREPLLDPVRLAGAAANLAEAEEALAWAAEREWAARARIGEGEVALDPAGLPPELVRRLAARAIDRVRPGSGPWRRDGLADALAALAEGRPRTLAGVRILPGPLWRFAPAPPRRSGR